MRETKDQIIQRQAGNIRELQQRLANMEEMRNELIEQTRAAERLAASNGKEAIEYGRQTKALAAELHEAKHEVTRWKRAMSAIAAGAESAPSTQLFTQSLDRFFRAG